MTRQWTTCFAAVLLVAIAGVGTAQPESIEELRARAEQGDADAQSSLGLAYATGRGVSQDAAEAVRWFRLAAEQGHANAQFGLGIMYSTGQGVAQDDVQAYLWFTLAAARSNDEARERAVKHRDSVYGRLTVDQLAESQQLAQEWNKAHPRFAIAGPVSVR